MSGNKDNRGFIMVLAGITAFFGALALIILLVYVWIPQIKYGKEDELQQSESSAASLYADESTDEDTKEYRDVISADEKKEEPDTDSSKESTEKVAKGNFQVTMSTEWNYPDPDTPAEDSYVENARNNSYDTRFIVALADDESNVLYESPLMPVGSCLSGIPLHGKLSSGKYNCVVVYTLYRPGTEEEAGNVRIGLTINVL